MKILCWIGFHDEWPEINNIYFPHKVIFRTYMKCKRCGKWGVPVFFKEEEFN